MIVLELSPRLPPLKMKGAVNDGSLYTMIDALNCGFNQSSISSQIFTSMAPGAISTIDQLSSRGARNEVIIDGVAGAVATFKMLLVMSIMKQQYGSVDFDLMNEVLQRLSEQEVAAVEILVERIAALPVGETK